MYSILADGVCIYNDVFALESMKAIDPKLTLEDNTAGSLVMTLPPVNIGYNSIVRMMTDITVLKDGEELWAGRVLSEDKDFWNNRILYCEGELAFFNDSSQPPAEYAGLSIRAYLEKLLQIHNSKVRPNRQFSLGAVTVVDTNYPTYYTNNESTISILNGLVETYGGHLIVRKVNGTRYLDYMKEYPDTSSQSIQFGANLIDFTRKWDSSEFATVLVPLGKRLDNSPIEALDAYLTVESVNHGSMYIQSNEAVAAYGWIEKVVTWDNVDDPSILLEKGKQYLSELQFDNLEIELSALDLHYLDIKYEAVKLLDEIEVISRPHGLDRTFPVTKLEIPLDSPEKTLFKLGDTVRTSLTSVNNQTSAAIWEKIEALPKAHSLLKEAKENATEIMNRATTGYITIVQDEYGSETLYISNVRDYTKADKLWKWNMNGLGYSNDGGKTYGLAITMDGSIVADYITSGVLNADLIRAGVLKDPSGNFTLDMATGKLTMKKGSINIGNGNFTVDEEGNLYARRGTFAGTLSGANGTFGGNLVAAGGTFSGDLVAAGGTFKGNLSAAGGTFTGELVAASGKFSGVVQASDFLDQTGKSMMNSAKQFTASYLDLYGLTIRNKSTGAVTFEVDGSTGAVTVSGNISMGAGSSINWATVTNVNLGYNPAYTLASTANTTANKARDEAADALDDADAAWDKATDAYRERCTDQNVFNTLTNNGTLFGIFSDSTYNRLYINANYIRAGTINADWIDLACNNGGFCAGTGYDGQYTTYGAMMFGSNGYGKEPYFIVTNRGCRMTSGKVSFWVSDKVSASEAISVSSDLRIKEEVGYDLDKYDKFFLSLKPTCFKYKKGTSGRTHLGFIAQDVEWAMVDAGLTSMDLAALIKAPVEEVLDDGIGDFRYSLRYSEFVALNVHMIQKLYRLVGELLEQKGEVS